MAIFLELLSLHMKINLRGLTKSWGPETIIGGHVVPAPAIGHGLPVLLAVGGLLFGAKLLERSKKQGALGTAVPNAVA